MPALWDIVQIVKCHEWSNDSVWYNGLRDDMNKLLDNYNVPMQTEDKHFYLACCESKLLSLKH